MNKLNHISFIPDGNNRWAKKNNYSMFDSYNKGANKILKITDFLFTKYSDLKTISFFILSTHNTNRKSFLKTYEMILKKFYSNSIQEKKYSKLNIYTIGKYNKFKKNIVEDINFLNKKFDPKNKTLLLCLNYSGLEEIISIINKSKNVKISLNNLKKLSYTKYFEDPDLIIRSGGYKRLSDFFLIQSTFSEFIFLKTLWPDITINQIKQSINKYENTLRKFGKF